MNKLIFRIILVLFTPLLTLKVTAQTIGLGTASQFTVLAGSGITNTGPTTIAGDIGTFPTTSQTGFNTITLSGANHAGDAVTQQAKNDLITAYNVAAGLTVNFTLSSAEIGGLTLPPGVYSSASSVGLTGTVTLNAAGNPDAVWVFQIGSTLITASDSSVLLINGAQACHVFWQVGSSATLGTNTDFAGTIMASESITANTGTTVLGRLLALNGAVTLDTNTIAEAICKKLVDDPTTTTPNGTNDTNGSSDKPSIQELKNTLILAGQLVNVSTLPGLTSIYTQGFAQFDTQVFSLQQRFADLRASSRASRFSTPPQIPAIQENHENPWSGSGKNGSGKSRRHGKVPQSVLPDEVQITDDHHMGFFITGSGDSTTAGEANSFDGRTIGTSLGVDWRLNDHCVTGISLSYSHSRSELMPVGKVNSDGAKVALYSLYHRGSFYTEGLIGGGYNSYDIERSAFLGTARGSTNGAQFDAYLGMGYDIIREGWTVTPMISWLYTVVGIEGYNEIGSLVPLNIDTQHASSLRVRIGPRIAHTSQWGIASVTPSFSAQWQHEFLDDQLPFEARFSNAPGTPFTVYGPKIGRDSILITAALNIAWRRYAAFIAYQADLGRENYERQTALVGLRVSW